MRYWFAIAALLLIAGCKTPGARGNEPASANGSKDPAWREDQKTGERPAPDTAEKPADSGDPKSSEPAQPKAEEPAQPKVDSQPDKPKDPPAPDTAKPAPAEPDKTAKPQPGPMETVDPKAQDKLADEFIKAVKGMAPQLEKSKSFLQFKADNKNFTEKQEKAMEERRKASDKAVIEQAWADAIKAWYEARYSLARFVKLHSNAKDFETVSIKSFSDVKALRADQLRSNDCRKANAASNVADQYSTDLKIFRNTTLKYDLTANEVFESKDWAKVFGDAQKKFDECANGKFDEADLKKFKD